MSNDDLNFHRERERDCRSRAELASSPDVRRRHEELAELHASRVAQFDGFETDADAGSAI